MLFFVGVIEFSVLAEERATVDINGADAVVGVFWSLLCVKRSRIGCWVIRGRGHRRSDQKAPRS